MKTTFALKAWLLRSVVCLILLLSLALPRRTMAQNAVTAQFTHQTNAVTSTNYSGTGATGSYPSGITGNTYNYDFGADVTSPNFTILDSFTAAALNWHFVAPTTVKFQRADNATATGLRKSLWFEEFTGSTVPNGGTAYLLPEYDDSLERIFSQGQIFNIGIDNNFQNQGNGSGTNNNNIERVDHIITSGTSATDNTKAGFVVFDRGNNPSHDPFYIAAIASLDASGNPSGYYNAVHVVATNYGNDVSPSMSYIIFRENPGDGKLLMMNNTTSQYRDGVLLTFQNLGVPAGTTIYGYSLFPADLGSTAAANLVNYKNTTYFPTNSNFASGGIDQVAISGLWVTKASYIVLPDRIKSFSAHTVNGKVELDWTLGTFDDIAKVVVERSADGENFSPLLQIEAPLAAQQNAYDESPAPGNDYYRIKLVDMRGMEAAYSTVSRVQPGAAQAGVRLMVYPNPVVNGRLSFSGQGLSADSYTLRVMDMSGHPVATQTFSGGMSFGGSLSLPSALPTGVYPVQLVDKGGHPLYATTVECH